MKKKICVVKISDSEIKFRKYAVKPSMVMKPKKGVYTRTKKHRIAEFS